MEDGILNLENININDGMPTQPQTWTQLIRLLRTVHFTQFAPNSTFPVNILIEMSLLQVHNNHVKNCLKNNLN